MPRIVTTAACVCGSILLCVILGRSSAAATVEELRQNAAQLQDAAARCRVQMAQGRGCVVRVQFRNNERISVEAAEVLAAELLEEADRLAGQAPQDTPQSLIAKHSSWTGLDEAGLASELHGRLPQEADAVQAVLDLLSSEDRDDVAYELLSRTSDDTLKALAADVARGGNTPVS